MLSPQHEPTYQETRDQLSVRVYPDRRTMGRAAARRTAVRMRALQDKQEQMRMIFAAAPSQKEFLEALIDQPGLDWSAVTAFHMDEYLQLPSQAPQQFSQWLQRHLFAVVQCPVPAGSS